MSLEDKDANALKNLARLTSLTLTRLFSPHLDPNLPLLTLPIPLFSESSTSSHRQTKESLDLLCESVVDLSTSI